MGYVGGKPSTKRNKREKDNEQQTNSETSDETKSDKASKRREDINHADTYIMHLRSAHSPTNVHPVVLPYFLHLDRTYLDPTCLRAADNSPLRASGPKSEVRASVQEPSPPELWAG